MVFGISFKYVNEHFNYFTSEVVKAKSKKEAIIKGLKQFTDSFYKITDIQPLVKHIKITEIIRLKSYE